jgi:hypothetical protein
MSYQDEVNKAKNKAKKYIEKEQLISFMNNTKWEEFRKAMLEEMPFPPPYILKTILMYLLLNINILIQLNFY